MKTRRLGKSNVPVSEVGLGCWQLGGDFGPMEEERAQAILGETSACGIDFWDTADVYGNGESERRIGRFLSESSARPVVATKVGRSADLYPDGYTKEKVRASLAASARRLGVDTLDLVQLHCVPPAVLASGDMLTWMEDLREEGMLRHYGASVETAAEARTALDFPGLTSLQIIFNLFRQDPADDILPLAQARDVGIIVRLPLASGVLAGRMTRRQAFASSDHRSYNRQGDAFSQGETFSGIPFETALDLVEGLRERVPEGMSMAGMAMRWILDHPAVTTVIAGASRPEQVRQNAAAAALAPLPESLHDELAAFYRREVAPHIVVPL